jgi:hypothetical protein
MKGSWLILVVLTVAGGCFYSARIALSILAGGIIALGNHYWLRSIMERVLLQQRQDARRYAILRFLLRLTLLGLLVMALVRFGVNIIGLLIGLSVVVISTLIISVHALVSPKGE